MSRDNKTVDRIPNNKVEQLKDIKDNNTNMYISRSEEILIKMLINSSKRNT